jgi:hypothetical protein
MRNSGSGDVYKCELQCLAKSDIFPPESLRKKALLRNREDFESGNDFAAALSRLKRGPCRAAGIPVKAMLTAEGGVKSQRSTQRAGRTFIICWTSFSLLRSGKNSPFHFLVEGIVTMLLGKK